MDNTNRQQIDIEVLRKGLENKQGQEYWRSLDELADTQEFQQWMGDEFPNRDSLMQIDRRKVLKLMGASFALAGLSGCRSPVWPNPKIVPYVNQPEEIVPGKPLYFATGWTQSGLTHGIVVTSHMGRPIKVDGNTMHASNKGTSNHFMQASILNLYDPERTKVVSKEKVVTGWDQFMEEARAQIKSPAAAQGKGVRILSRTTSSPTMINKVRALMAKYPLAKWVTWEPVNRDQVYQGVIKATGINAEPIYNLNNTKVIVALDANFLGEGAQQMTMAKAWAKCRSVESNGWMSRMYSFHIAPSVTSASADHAFPVSTVELKMMVRALAVQLGVAGVSGVQLKPEEAKIISAIATDLNANRGVSAVIPGDFCDSEVHQLAHLINAKIGSLGSSPDSPVSLAPQVVARAGQQTSDFAGLCRELNNGEVQTLFVIGGDPVFNAPSDFKFAEGMAKVPFTVYAGTMNNGTAKASMWAIPTSHELESWGDGAWADGTMTIIQPLIDPLYDTKTDLEIICGIFGETAEAYELVKAHWKQSGAFGGNFEANWRKALNDGVAKVAPARVVPTVVSVNLPPMEEKAGGLEVILRPDPTIFDGTYINNGWLQELPKSMTTLVWDNSIQISPKLAEQMKAKEGNIFEVTVGGNVVRGPIWIQPGMPTNTMLIHYGYGVDFEGVISRNTGFNAQAIATQKAMYGAEPATLKSVGGQVWLAATQTHNTMEGRDIIREKTVGAYLAGADTESPASEAHGEGHGEKGESHKDISMYDAGEHEYDGAKWGMSIDLNVCTGCHACVIACQSENNIAVVGKDEVTRGREMHWIRIDRYYGPKDASTFGAPNISLDHPSVSFMPVACMHCENAPCEPVCPVAATVHSHEGLNQMVYNRCVGTRYCSNNCPYKVRRFNFLNYNDRKFTEFPEYKDLRVKLQVNNPNVTVRGRGVMEKCTFCVQRINSARIDAKVEFSKGRRDKAEPKDGEVITACQAACPTGAIIFGNIADKESKVSKAKAIKRDYSLLEELNTVNRLTYLHKLRNPNKELETV